MRNVIRVAFPACRRVRRSKHAVVMCIGVVLLVYLILANDVFPEYNHVRADSVVVMKMDEAVTQLDQGINFDALPEAAPRDSSQSRASVPELQAPVNSSSASKTASLFSLFPRASASVPFKDTATFASLENGSYNNNKNSSNNSNNNNSNNNSNNKNGVSEGSHNHIDAKLHQNIAQRESSKGDDSVVVRTEQTGSLGGSKGNNAQEQPRSESGLPLTGKGGDSSSSVLLAGVPRKHKVYLTIGMVTVKREKADYFFTTMASLLDHSSQAEQREITIVVMLADRNQDHNQLVLRQIQDRYPRELQSGLILVIRGPNTDFIFEKNDVKRTYQDSLQRVQWRSKQNMDYAAVIEFAIPLSAFYLHIEDDVVSADSYFRHIRDFIGANEKKLWAMLEVCPHGFIGKLFKNVDLPKLVMILRAFYLEQPCDFLIGYFTKMMTQAKPIVRPGALFFHQGKFSTLFNVTRKTDKLPGQGQKSPVAKVIRKTGNPAAEVFSDFEVYENHVVDYAYNLQTNKFLWALDLKEGQRYTVVFTVAQRLKQLVIETGFSNENPKDRLHHANIEMGTEPPDSEGSLVCPGAKVAGTFENGRVEVKLIPAHNIRCFSVVVKATQKEWVVMREIIVTTE